jgi:hypothetical protein
MWLETETGTLVNADHFTAIERSADRIIGYRIDGTEMTLRNVTGFDEQGLADAMAYLGGRLGAHPATASGPMVH